MTKCIKPITISPEFVIMSSSAFILTNGDQYKQSKTCLSDLSGKRQQKELHQAIATKVIVL